MAKSQNITLTITVKSVEDQGEFLLVRADRGYCYKVRAKLAYVALLKPKKSVNIDIDAFDAAKLPTSSKPDGQPPEIKKIAEITIGGGKVPTTEGRKGKGKAA